RLFRPWSSRPPSPRRAPYTTLFRSLCSLQGNGNSVPLLLLSGSPGHHDLPATGATFFFEKPISVEQAVRTLSAARNMMLTGRLRDRKSTWLNSSHQITSDPVSCLTT